jgi:SAM-dependent methyltransferase
LEFASRGARVVAIEGRESNNAKARASAIAQNITGIEFVTDDVRNLRLERYGKFDVVLCSGILYHLPGEDGCRLIQTISEVCDHLAIIDTHVGLTDFKTVQRNGKTYSGIVFQEHASTDSAAVRLERAWASLDNETSFWITKPSLMNLLRDVGFTTVLEVFRPVSFFVHADRITIAAVKGTAIPLTEGAPEADYPEHLNLPAHPGQAHFLGALTVPTWKRIARRVRRVILRH